MDKAVSTYLGETNSLSAFKILTKGSSKVKRTRWLISVAKDAKIPPMAAVAKSRARDLKQLLPITIL